MSTHHNVISAARSIIQYLENDEHDRILNVLPLSFDYGLYQVIMTFMFYVFVNIGMVSGILPVVGVPLPLVSYGGTSMVTLMIGFGILMSVQSEGRKLSRT